MTPVNIQLFFIAGVGDAVGCPFAFLLADIVVWCQFRFLLCLRCCFAAAGENYGRTDILDLHTTKSKHNRLKYFVRVTPANNITARHYSTYVATTTILSIINLTSSTCNQNWLANLDFQMFINSA